jgi:hypothetical protein
MSARDTEVRASRIADSIALVGRNAVRQSRAASHYRDEHTEHYFQSKSNFHLNGRFPGKFRWYRVF